MPITEPSVEEQAKYLAEENRKADPSIQKVYWFPHAKEIRLVELTEEIPAAIDGEVRPFWFRPSPKDGLTAPSGIALIRPGEFRKLKLPDDWPSWEEAKEL